MGCVKVSTRGDYAARALLSMALHGYDRPTSVKEIAERLFVSRNTVKSQAISVYRKLNASSRSEAIERAVELGLVDAPLPTQGGFTPSG